MIEIQEPQTILIANDAPGDLRALSEILQEHGYRIRVAANGKQALESARLVNLRGTRRTYVAVQRGQVLHVEDSILGNIEFRPRAARTASAGPAPSYSVELTGGRDRGMDMQGMRGERGDRRGSATRGARARTSQRAGTGRRAAPGAAPGRAGAAGGGRIPRSLDYGLRLTSSLIAR